MSNEIPDWITQEVLAECVNGYEVKPGKRDRRRFSAPLLRSQKKGGCNGECEFYETNVSLDEDAVRVHWESGSRLRGNVWLLNISYEALLEAATRRERYRQAARKRKAWQECVRSTVSSLAEDVGTALSSSELVTLTEKIVARIDQNADRNVVRISEHRSRHK